MTTFTQDDLIALHLRELSPRRSRALRRALALNPALAAESEAIAFTLASFDSAPTPPMNTEIFDRTWNAVRPAMLKLPQPSPLHLWRVPMTAAAGLSLTAAAILWVAVWTAARPTIRNAPQHQAPASVSPASGHTTVAAAQPNELPTQPRQLSIPPRTNTNQPRHNSYTPEMRATLPAAASLHQPLTLASLIPPAKLPLEPSQPFETTSLASSSNPFAMQHPEATEQASTAASNSKSTRTHKPHDGVQTDLSIEGGGSFSLARSTTTSSTTSGVTSTDTQSQSLRPSAAVLVTFHQQISPRVGYQVSAGFTRTIFEYGGDATALGSSVLSSGAVQTNIYEVSAAYVAQGPHNHRVSTYADAGPGLITFVPRVATQATGHSFRPSLVAGAGINIRLKHHWSLRAEYRAMFVKGPDFRDRSVSIPFNAQYTVSSQPILGLTYNFNGIRP